MVELGRNFRGSAPRGYIAQPAGFNDPLVLGDADVDRVVIARACSSCCERTGYSRGRRGIIAA
jgi:hypothetical protein